jgi:hypothetical protein
MTEEQFRQEMEEFWTWVSKRERARRHWYLSLEEWASAKYDEAMKRDKEEGRVETA